MFTTKIEIDVFIDEYKRSRVIIETSVRASLNRALEFEAEFQKPFYAVQPHPHWKSSQTVVPVPALPAASTMLPYSFLR